MNQKRFTVYLHLSPNMKIYVGITSQNPEYRWNNGYGYRTQPYFYNAICKYGWGNITHIILAEGLTEKQATELEIDSIKYWNTTNPKNGYNRSTGGEFGGTGRKHTKEAKLKMSMARKGIVFSEETKRKMAIAKIGIPLSDEHKEKISIANLKMSAETKRRIRLASLGRQHTQETKDKISAGGLGRKCSTETKHKLSVINTGKCLSDETKKKMSKPVLQYTLDGIFIKEWDGIKIASTKLNINPVAVSACCRKVTNTSGGYMWKFKSENCP